MPDELYIERLLQRLVDERELLSREELICLKQVLDSYEGRVYIETRFQNEWSENKEQVPGVDFDKLYDQIEQRIRKSKNTPRWLAVIRQYAAFLVLPLLATTIYFFYYTEKQKQQYGWQFENRGYEYYTPAGTKSRILLPDSTSIWMNAASRLWVQSGFGKEHRKVKLVGEAYFEVTHRDLLPFVVQTDKMDITVLGTSFNVSAYPDDNKEEAVLVKGMIQAEVRKEYQGKEQIVRLMPDQKLVLDKALNKIRRENNISSAYYTAWKDELMVFQNTPMEEVAKTLERWFNVTVFIRDEELKEYAYTGKFANRSLEQIMKFIQLSTPVTYTMTNDSVIISR